MCVCVCEFSQVPFQLANFHYIKSKTRSITANTTTTHAVCYNLTTYSQGEQQYTIHNGKGKHNNRAKNKLKN